jgi:hypothetical protein
MRESRARAHWQYAIPGEHSTFRLDQAAHDQLFVIASRHPLRDPAAELSGDTHTSSAGELELPLRDGRAGSAVARLSSGSDVVVTRYDLR